ncbi:MAG: hypothetical protein R3E31_28710 [Chloroflexota bacterium]
MSAAEKRFALTLFGLPQLTQQEELASPSSGVRYGLCWLTWRSADGPKSRDHLAAPLAGE